MLRVTGQDAAVFLQGQFTQELRRKSPSALIPAYGLWLSQKGKVLGDSWVLGVAETEFWIVSLFSPGRVLKERLEAYIVADDVGVEDLSGQYHGCMIGGSRAEEAGKAAGLERSAADGFRISDGRIIFSVDRGIPGSFEVLAPGDSHVQLSDARELSGDEMEAFRLDAGIVRVPRELGPGDLPQEAGLEDRAISFTKGCYLGQEVMARLRSLGQIRRKLHVVTGDVDVPPEALPVPLFQAGKRVGDLRSWIRPAGSLAGGGMAMVSLSALAPDRALTLAPEGAGAAELRIVRSL